MPVVNRLSINSNNDVEHCEMLGNRKTKNDKNNDTFRNYASSVGFTVVVQHEEGTVLGRGDHNHSNRSCGQNK